VYLAARRWGLRSKPFAGPIRAKPPPPFSNRAVQLRFPGPKEIAFARPRCHIQFPHNEIWQDTSHRHARFLCVQEQPVPGELIRAELHTISYSHEYTEAGERKPLAVAHLRVRLSPRMPRTPLEFSASPRERREVWDDRRCSVRAVSVRGFPPSTCSRRRRRATSAAVRASLVANVDRPSIPRGSHTGPQD